MRTAVVGVLVVLGALLAPVALTAVWADRLVNDTDRYVQTVAPLADEPAIQAEVTERVTRAIVRAIEESVPAEPPAGLRRVVEPQVARLVRSEEFATAWREVNREAHAQLVLLLTGEGEAVTVEDNAVTLDLAVVVEAVRDRLQREGFPLADRIPDVNVQLTLVQSDDVARLQAAVRLLDRLAFFLPPLAVALIVVGVLLARSRRRALIAAALTVSAAAMLFVLGLALARDAYLEALPADSVDPAAAEVAFEVLVRFLHRGLLVLAVVGLVVGLVTWLVGSVRWRTRGSGTARVSGA